MAKSTTQVADILRVEGIMAQGYGLNPKIVMRDKRLTTTAKAIYAYISSFAGAGKQAFPNRDMMIEELQISKDTYYKHLKYLIDADYIRIERTRNKKGIYEKNIYTIVALPNPKLSDNTINDDENKKENMNNEEKADKQKKTNIKRLKVKERASVNELRERLEIDKLKLSDPDNADIIEDVFMAVEDMNSSEQISIAGNIKKKEAIQELLNQLTADNIRLVTQIMSKNKKPLLNRKSYIQTCLINSIFDLRHKKVEVGNLDSKKKEEKREQEQRQKAEAEKQKLFEAYEKYPELKKIDQELTEVVKKISRAVLSKDQKLLKKLEEEKELLIKEREKYNL